MENRPRVDETLMLRVKLMDDLVHTIVQTRKVIATTLQQTVETLHHVEEGTEDVVLAVVAMPTPAKKGAATRCTIVHKIILQGHKLLGATMRQMVLTSYASDVDHMIIGLGNARQATNWLRITRHFVNPESKRPIMVKILEMRMTLISQLQILKSTKVKRRLWKFQTSIKIAIVLFSKFIM
jgi:hypothetical protein